MVDIFWRPKISRLWASFHVRLGRHRGFPGHRPVFVHPFALLRHLIRRFLPIHDLLWVLSRFSIEDAFLISIWFSPNIIHIHNSLAPIHVAVLIVKVLLIRLLLRLPLDLLNILNFIQIINWVCLERSVCKLIVVYYFGFQSWFRLMSRHFKANVPIRSTVWTAKVEPWLLAFLITLSNDIWLSFK